MCGIIAYTGADKACPILLDGLRRLEYRGYDSAGISVYSRKRVHTWKAAGKLGNLEAQLPASVAGTSGIGHTRWATHGEPNDQNAHPHTDASGRIAIVHNGIIENADALRHVLMEDGVCFSSETDSELLAHLLAQHKGSLIEVMRRILGRIQGTYGIAAMDRRAPGTLVVARQGSPVILGVGERCLFAASDMSALLRHTRDVIHLDDGEVAELTPGGFEITTLDARVSGKQPTTVTAAVDDYDRGGFSHYLLREINDQPDVLERTLKGRLDRRFSTAHLGGLNLDARALLDVQRIKILGCGSAYYAGMAGAQMIETLARLPSDAEPAAEFRYRNPIIERHTLYIVVSQSGETFDTLAALREIQRKGGYVLGVVNSVGSSIAREVDGGIYMHAGPEVSVASTKAYTCMLSVFALLALMLGRLRDVSPQQGTALIEALEQLPDQLRHVLELETQIQAIAQRYCQCGSAFFVGRTSAYPIALEGAQKLKEVSYIHAEAYPASELKHGPLALVTKETPCVIVLPDSGLIGKSLGSLEEVKARGAPVIAITDSNLARIDALADEVVRVPSLVQAEAHSSIGAAFVQPMTFGVVLQLLAYHSAVALGRDVDQPRNLAKSVTVE